MGSAAETAAERGTPSPLLFAVRRVARWLRYWPQQMLHPARRRRALRALEARKRIPASVLFVCDGNICRSPYAEAAFRRALPASLRPRVRVSSAGFFGPDRPSPPEAQTVARQRAIDISGHRSKLLSDSAVQEADLIVVMDDRQRRALRQRFDMDPSAVLVLGDLDPLPIERRTIRDPYAQPRDVFEVSYSRIDRCLARITERLSVTEATDPLDQGRA